MSARAKTAYRLSIYDVACDAVVVCPSCSGGALVTGGNAPDRKAFDIVGIRAVCPCCGWSRVGEKVSRRSPRLVYGAPVDPYFHLPLWLQIECCGELLWAYNAEHLELLREHVSARLRERNGFPLRSRSIGARLPRWVTSAKNRNAVLRGLDRLAQKLQDS